MAPKKDKEVAVKKTKVPEEQAESPPEPVPPEPTSGCSKFYFLSGATYEGEWMLVPDPNAELAQPEPKKESKKGGKDAKKATKGEPKKASKDVKADDRDPKEKNHRKDEKSQKADKIDEEAPAEGDSTNIQPEILSRPNRVRHGKGIYIHGEYRYEGEWKMDQMDGKGTFLYASGASYEGTFEMDKYSGIGVYKWPDGRSYTGEWRENKMHGAGVYIDRDGQTYVGQFFNGIGPGLLCEIK